MDSLDNIVQIELKKIHDVSEETIRGMAEQNSANIASIIGVDMSDDGDIFSDSDTPQEATLTGEIKTLLNEYQKLTQQLVADAEKNLNDIFAP
ncbi:hypothetical protein [Vagococcus sp. WN89Y]|uniref:hypothetical protein n=1 Tax=Vagococcus sp. WN89Y TaxID=3457258 RepID=UPI003FCD5CE8